MDNRIFACVNCFVNSQVFFSIDKHYAKDIDTGKRCQVSKGKKRSLFCLRIGAT